MNNEIAQAKQEYAATLERLKGKAPELSIAFPDVSQIAEPEPSVNLPESSNGTDNQNSNSPSANPRLKGFGYLYKRGNLWWIRYSVRGKDFRESSGSEKDTDAMRLLKRRWKEVGRGRFIGPSEERVMADNLLDGLVNDYEINRRRSARTLNWRLRHLRAAFGGMRAVDVTEERIERYKVDRLAEKTERGKKPVRPATINRELAALRRAFRLAVRQKGIATAPAISMLQEDNVRQGFVEPKEFEAIVNNLPEYLRDLSRFAYFTGWRKGELQTLTWADVNREAQRVILRQENSKNREPRLLPLTGTLAEIIERRWQARVIENPDGSTGLAEFVFHCGNGRPVGDFRRAWATGCKEAGMPGLLFHDLRRSAVRNFDKSGVSQPIGMMISGHKTASVYRRYRIAPEQDIREALERTEAAIAQSKERRVIPIAEAKEASR
jgi:integrase